MCWVVFNKLNYIWSNSFSDYYVDCAMKIMNKIKDNETDNYVVRILVHGEKEADMLCGNLRMWLAERDEARKLAEEWRDYAIGDGRHYGEPGPNQKCWQDATNLPWEVEK